MMRFLLIISICLLSGCATIKGIAHDVSWTAGKVDQAIHIPDQSETQMTSQHTRR